MALTYAQEIKEGNEELLSISYKIHALLDEWERKEMPAEVEKELDGLEEKAASLRRRGGHYATAADIAAHADTIADDKRIAIPGQQSITPASYWGGEGVEAETQELLITPEMKDWIEAMFSGDPQGRNKYLRKQQIFHPRGAERYKAMHAYLRGSKHPLILSRLTRDRDILKPGEKAGGEFTMLAEDAEFKAALNEATTTQGGFLTPDLFAQEIILPLANASWMRAAGAHVMPVNSDIFKFPREIYSAAAVLTGEGSAYDEKEPTYQEQTFTQYKFTKEVVASEELVEDSRFDLWGELIQPDVVQAFSEAENSYMATGTGTSQPEGITNLAATVTLTTGQTTGITSADSIIDTYFSLDFKYRAAAKWMMHDSELKIVRKLKDSQNRYILADNVNNLTAPLQMTILGSPVVINNGMPVAAANAKSIVYGNFYYFMIADRSGLTVKYADQLLAANGRVAWFVRKRFDSHPMLTAAFAVMAHSAT